MKTKSTFKLAIGSAFLATGVVLGGCINNPFATAHQSGVNPEVVNDAPDAAEPTEDVSSLAREMGYRPQTPEEHEQFIQSLQTAGITVEIGAEKSGVQPTEAALPTAYSAPVTVIRSNQGNHMTCWCFAAAAAYESNHKKHGTTINVSEESILDQSLFGDDVVGGTLEDAYYTMLVPAMARETDYGYKGTKTSMPWGIAKPYRGWMFGYAENANVVASRAKIKQAIYDHGAVGAAMAANQAFVDHRGSGVFSADAGNMQVNHAIAIVGWSDAKGAWRIKNSWGSGWGDGGFAWVKYGTSKIGFDASYVESLQ